MIAEGITQLVGNTPLVRLNFPEIPAHVTLYGKLEGNNPAGSVKDRPVRYMIEQALRSKDIQPETKIIEATSGNTGIALAMVCASLDLDLTLVMPENATAERIHTMKAYGANVVLTPAEKTIEYSRQYAMDKVLNEGYFMCNQFDNPNNYLAHYETTGPEIWQDTNGTITHFVATMGTTGTIMGNSMYLKEKNPSIQIIGVQPEEGSRVPGIRKWTAEYMPAIYDPSRVDRIEYVSEDKAKTTTRRLAKELGIFVGISSGGSTSIALDLCKTLTAQAVVVCILCDRGDRYLSSDVFGNPEAGI